jgi:hypothetical protein
MRRAGFDKELIRAAVVLVFILVALWLGFFVLPNLISSMFLSGLH